MKKVRMVLVDEGGIISPELISEVNMYNIPVAGEFIQMSVDGPIHEVIAVSHYVHKAGSEGIEAEVFVRQGALTPERVINLISQRGGL